jgi:hypothetical protein
MNLDIAQKLLAEDGVSTHYKHFIETYRVFDFKDETPLKEYIDFITHEPLVWLQSFPAKLKSKPAFSKPKTALLKLLKESKVIEQLGADYCTKAHDLIDKTYKQHGDAIVAKRTEGESAVVVTKEEEGETVEPAPTQTIGRHPTLTVEEIESLESDSTRSSHPSLVEEHRELEKKYRVLKKAYEVLLKSTLPEGQYQSVQLLMNLL